MSPKIKLDTEPLMLDVYAKPEDFVQVETQREAGNPGKFKLYVHFNGRTILRICKLSRSQISVERQD